MLQRRFAHGRRFEVASRQDADEALHRHDTTRAAADFRFALRRRLQFVDNAGDRVDETGARVGPI
ncbi:MAG TPA: hypothetical protein VGQ10_10635, partial [Vicinamibacterales bacterium]|nr:hypothetical protein [Vicinamibacterales bacterium]